MSKPFLPLFVFDGPKRPKMKRKKKVSGKDHWMISGMQEIIEAFGFEWRMVSVNLYVCVNSLFTLFTRRQARRRPNSRI